MKIEAAVLVTQNAPLEIWDLEVPPLKEGQVLVKIAYSGLCHSQLNEVRGLKGEDPYLPHTLGHEGSGIVESVGPNVTKVKKGDPVVISWIKGKGLEGGGCIYESRFCRVNSGPISTFGYYSVISENRMCRIPSHMPLREAALLGCAIPTGAGVVKNEMELKEGRSFAVYGAGGVGLSALLAAKFLKADPIIAVDVHEQKLKKAKELGATVTIDATKQDPVQGIMHHTEGKGVDFVFESAGNKEAMEKAFCSLKAPGLCVLAGNLPKGERIAIDPFDLIRGKRLIGTWGGKSDIEKDIGYYVDLYLKGNFPLKDLITHEVRLTEINSLLTELSQGKVGRGLVSFI